MWVLPDYGWEAVGANLATSVFGLDGSGIGIAIIDSGANNDQDVKNLEGRADSCTRPVWSRIPTRTTTMATALMSQAFWRETEVNRLDKNSTYLVRGIAPNANLISIKVLNDTGMGTDSTVIAGIQLAMQLKINTTSG